MLTEILFTLFLGLIVGSLLFLKAQHSLKVAYQDYILRTSRISFSHDNSGNDYIETNNDNRKDGFTNKQSIYGDQMDDISLQSSLLYDNTMNNHTLISPSKPAPPPPPPPSGPSAADSNNNDNNNNNNNSNISGINNNNSNNNSTKLSLTNPAIYTDPLFWPQTAEHVSLRKEYKSVFKALNIIRDLVMRDFVEYWFRSGVSSTDKKFMGHVKVLIDGMFNILVQRIMVTAHWTNFLIDRIITPLQHLLSLYSAILDDMERNDANFRRLKTSEQDAQIAEEIRSQYRLHPACKNEESAIKFLRQKSELIVEEVTDDRNYHCLVVRFLGRELFCNIILMPLVGFTDPYYINYYIYSWMKPIIDNEKKNLEKESNPSNNDNDNNNNNDEKKDNDDSNTNTNTNTTTVTTIIDEKKKDDNTQFIALKTPNRIGNNSNSTNNTNTNIMDHSTALMAGAAIVDTMLHNNNNNDTKNESNGSINTNDENKHNNATNESATITTMGNTPATPMGVTNNTGVSSSLGSSVVPNIESVSELKLKKSKQKASIMTKFNKKKKIKNDNNNNNNENSLNQRKKTRTKWFGLKKNKMKDNDVTNYTAIIDDYIEDEKYDCILGKSLRIHKKRIQTESMEGKRSYDTHRRRGSIDNGELEHSLKKIEISWIGKQFNDDTDSWVRFRSLNKQYPNDSKLFNAQNESKVEIFDSQSLPQESGKQGFSVTNKHHIPADTPFTLRLVSKNCVNLCARWVELLGHEMIPKRSSCRHFMREEYECCKYVYNWDDNVREVGDRYLQIGMNFIVSSHFDHENALAEDDYHHHHHSTNNDKSNIESSNKQQHLGLPDTKQDRGCKQRPTRQNTLTSDEDNHGPLIKDSEDDNEEEVSTQMQNGDAYAVTSDSESKSKSKFNENERRKNAIYSQGKLTNAENDNSISSHTQKANDNENNNNTNETTKKENEQKEENKFESNTNNNIVNMSNLRNCKEKHFTVKRVFLPLDLPLIHFYFYQRREGSERPENLIRSTMMKQAQESMDDQTHGKSSFFDGSILNEFRALGGAIGDTIKQALPSMSDITEIETPTGFSVHHHYHYNAISPFTGAAAAMSTRIDGKPTPPAFASDDNLTRTASQSHYSRNSQSTLRSHEFSSSQQQQQQHSQHGQQHTDDDHFNNIQTREHSKSVAMISPNRTTKQGMRMSGISSNNIDGNNKKKKGRIRNLIGNNNNNNNQNVKKIKKKDYHPSAEEIELQSTMTMEQLGNHEITDKCELRIADIIRGFDPKPYTQYVLKVTDRGGPKKESNIEWKVKTRFSKIKSFDKAIRKNKLLKHKKIPKFPPDVFIGNLDKTKIKQRANELKQYFSGLSMITEVARTIEFKHFVIPPGVIEKYCKFDQMKNKNNNNNNNFDKNDSIDNYNNSLKDNHSNDIYGSPSIVTSESNQVSTNARIPPELPPPLPPTTDAILPQMSDEFGIYPLSMRARRHSIPGAMPDKCYRKPPLMEGDWRWENKFENYQKRLFGDPNAVFSDWESDIERSVSRYKDNKALKKDKKKKQQQLQRGDSSDVDESDAVTERDNENDNNNDDDSDHDGDDDSSSEHSLQSDELNDILSPIVSAKEKMMHGATNRQSMRNVYSHGGGGGHMQHHNHRIKRHLKSKSTSNLDEIESKLQSQQPQTPAPQPISKAEIMKRYARLTPAISGLIESFLDLEKRNWIGASIANSATRIFRFFFDGAIKKFLHSQMVSWTTSDSLAATIDYVREIVWPNGTLCQAAPPVEESEKLETAVNAREIMEEIGIYLVPDAIARMIGRSHVKSCLVKFHRFLQQELLVKHLFFTILESLLNDLFPKNVSRHEARLRQITADKQKEKKKKLEQKEMEQQQQQQLQQAQMQRHQMQIQQQYQAQIQQLQRTPYHHRYHHQHPNLQQQQYRHSQPPYNIAQSMANIRNNVNSGHQYQHQPPPPPKTNQYNSSGMKDYGAMMASDSFKPMPPMTTSQSQASLAQSQQQQHRQQPQPPPPPPYGKKPASTRGATSRGILGTKRKFGDNPSLDDSNYPMINGSSIQYQYQQQQQQQARQGAIHGQSSQPPPPSRRTKTFDASVENQQQQRGLPNIPQLMQAKSQQAAPKQNGKTGRLRAMFQGGNKGHESYDQYGNNMNDGNTSTRSNTVDGAFAQSGYNSSNRTNNNNNNNESNNENNLFSSRNVSINSNITPSIVAMLDNMGYSNSSNSTTNGGTNHGNSNNNNNNNNTNTKTPSVASTHANVRNPSKFLFKSNNSSLTPTVGNVAAMNGTFNINNNNHHNGNNQIPSNINNKNDNNNNNSNNNNNNNTYAASNTPSNLTSSMNPSIGIGRYNQNQNNSPNSRMGGYRYHNAEYYQAAPTKQKQFAGDESSDGDVADGDASEGDIWGLSNVDDRVNKIKLQNREKQERQRAAAEAARQREIAMAQAQAERDRKNNNYLNSGILSDDSDDENEISLAQVRKEEEEKSKQSMFGSFLGKVADTLAFTADGGANSNNDVKMERFLH